MAQVPAWILALLGVSAQNAFYGTSGNNTIGGNLDNNYIEGGDGSDTLGGNALQDILEDLLGRRDTLGYWNSDAGVTVDFSSLSPTVSGGDADGDTVTGFENIVGSSFDDVLTGNDGDNILVGGAGNDTMNGGDGDNIFVGGAGTNTIIGGDGKDVATLDWTIFDGIAPGETGDGGTIDLGAGDDNTIRFEADQSGTNGISVIVTQISANTSQLEVKENESDSAISSLATEKTVKYIVESNGRLRWDGTDSGDAFFTKDQDEIFYLKSGQDFVSSAGGNDVIFAGNQKDTIYAGSGDDMVYGEDGNDIITGGLGKDLINGGGGDDRIVYEDVQDSLPGGERDQIRGFDHYNASTINNERDRIDLSVIDANVNLNGDQAFVFIGTNNFSGTAGELMRSGLTISGDVNGDRVADIQFDVYTVYGGPTLVSGDFIL